MYEYVYLSNSVLYMNQIDHSKVTSSMCVLYMHQFDHSQDTRKVTFTLHIMYHSF